MVKEDVEQNRTEQSIMQKQKMDAFTQRYTCRNLSSNRFFLFHPAENIAGIPSFISKVSHHFNKTM
jgi:hypothetical protein